MESPEDRSAEAVTQTIDRELQMIRAAIDLVASGGSPRVVLSGLHFVEPLLVQAHLLPGAARVRIEPVWTASEELADIAVELAGAPGMGSTR